MFFSKTVGLLLADELERSLARAAAAECGLEPLDLADPGVSADLSQSLQAPCRIANQDWNRVQRPRVIVADVESAAAAGLLKGPDTLSREASTLLLLVRGAALGEVEGRCADREPGGLDTYPWVLRRPLHLDRIVEQLRKAAHASQVFAARDQAMLDELHRDRRILDSMSNGVAPSGASLPAHPLVYVNPAFERIIGYSAAESRGRNSRLLQNDDTERPELPKVREALGKQSAVQALLKNYRKDGTPFWNELYMSPIFDADGRLTHFVGFQNDVTPRVEAARQVEHLASHDSLTGLPNRALMMELLKQALLRARRAGRHVAVLLFDIDNFKRVNDEYGHEAGDRLLQAVAERLRRDTRSSEMAARIGADEFVVALEDLTAEFQAIDIMERLSSGLAEPFDIREEEFHPSASVGMAFFPRDGETPEALLKAADAAMCRSKDAFHRRAPAAKWARPTCSSPEAHDCVRSAPPGQALN
jgi:diguanylate cyclase (GGDEF)-like protein/PAS domain S-box-containing protein